VESDKCQTGIIQPRNAKFVEWKFKRQAIDICIAKSAKGKSSKFGIGNLT
jgi:hypothetical protein